MAGLERQSVRMKGGGRGGYDAEFSTPGGSVPYLWIGDGDNGCYRYVNDLHTLRKMKALLDSIIEKRER